MNGQDDVYLSPDELKVIIYPGNNNFAIIRVSLKNNSNRVGYSYVGISTSGKPSKNRWTTRLLIDTKSDGGKESLNFAITIPSRAVKESDKFFLQLDRPLLKSPKQKIPLTVKNERTGFLVFQIAGGSQKWVKINLETSRAELSWIPQQQFDILWNKDGFDVFWGTKKVSTWCWEMASKVGFRGCGSGISAIYEDKDSVMSFFPQKELFYLQ